MNYREKKTHYAELQGVSHYDADLELLRETDPGNKILKRRLTKNSSVQKELLWQLLSVGVDAKVIVANRRKFSKKTDLELNLGAAADICKQLVSVETIKEALELEKKLKQVTENLPEEEANQALEIARLKIEGLELIGKTSAKVDAENALLKLSLDKKGVHSQAVKIFNALGLQASDRKGSTIIPMLEEYKLTLIQGTTEEMPGSPAKGEQLSSGDLPPAEIKESASADSADAKKKDIPSVKKSKSTQISDGQA